MALEAPVKKKVVKKPKYEELPEIPDYERPELEVYEESDFDPSNFKKDGLQFPPREPEEPIPRVRPTPEYPTEELPEIADYEKPELEKYKKTPLEPAKKVEESPEQKGKISGPVRPKEEEPPALKPGLKPIPQKEGEEQGAKLKPKPKSKVEEVPEIEEYERPKLEKYEKTPFEPTKKEAEPAAQKGKLSGAAKPKEDEPTNANAKLKPGAKAEEPAPTEKVQKFRKPPATAEEAIADGIFKLKPTAKKVQPAEEVSEEAEVNIKAPKTLIKKTSTEDSADAKITPKKTPKPPTTVEESASKNVTIKGPEPADENPIEIMITEPEELKTDAKKKNRRTTYDPFAIPEADEERALQEEAAGGTPIPESPSIKPLRKYDPLKYIPDKEDLTPLDSVDGSDDTEVNTKHKQFYTKINLKLDCNFKVLNFVEGRL